MLGLSIYTTLPKRAAVAPTALLPIVSRISILALTALSRYFKSAASSPTVFSPRTLTLTTSSSTSKVRFRV